MQIAFLRRRTQWAFIAFAFLLCVMGGCGGPSREIVGRWRTADAAAIVWEFSSNGSVVVGKDKGRYSFGDQNRIKIETPFAKSVYQIEILGDRMTLRAPSGLKLEFTRVKEAAN